MNSPIQIFDYEDSRPGYIRGHAGLEDPIVAPSSVQKERYGGVRDAAPGQTFRIAILATPNAGNYLWVAIGFYDAEMVLITRPSVVSANDETSLQMTAVAPAGTVFARPSARFYDDGILSFETDCAGGGGSMTTFAQGHATNLARNSGGAVVDNLDGASPSSQGYRPEYAYFDMGNSLSFESAVRLTVSFDLVMTVANANPTLTVYNTNNKGPMQFEGVNALSGETHAAGETIEKRVAVTSSWSPRSDANRQTNYLEFYSTYGTGNYFSISNLMVELGDVAHPWSPSPLDEGVTGMIKASAEVTVYDQTDVVGIAQWHFATTSTTVPSKPATTDASATPSGWSRTEPTITSDSDLDKYVYVCVQTVWGDGSCTWGDVFLSASFEAAKRAYNKAQGAEKAAAAAQDGLASYKTDTTSRLDKQDESISLKAETAVTDAQGEQIAELLAALRVLEGRVESVVEGLTSSATFVQTDDGFSWEIDASLAALRDDLNGEVEARGRRMEFDEGGLSIGVKDEESGEFVGVRTVVDEDSLDFVTDEGDTLATLSADEGLGAPAVSAQQVTVGGRYRFTMLDEDAFALVYVG